MHGSPLGGSSRPVAGAALRLASALAFAFVAAGGAGATDANASETECLARAIYHEARGEDRAGRVAVAHAVLNRRGQPQFKPTICEVIRQGAADGSAGCQFSWACDGKPDQPRDEAMHAESRTLAEEVLAGQTQDPTDGAMWFHAADQAPPAWAKELARTARLGNHVFYKTTPSARSDGG